MVSLRLTILRHLPGRLVRPRVLDQLAQATAEAFETTAPRWRTRPFADRLATYAELTAAEAGRATGDTSARLRRKALALGRATRRRLGIRHPEEALNALTLLYRCIGIEITGRLASDTMGESPRGAVLDRLADIEVTRCFFADYYCDSACRLMSAMDAGVVDGLFGGASLEFTQRITDGSACCRAIITSMRVPA
jgi:hypothetical protein